MFQWVLKVSVVVSAGMVSVFRAPATTASQHHHRRLLLHTALLTQLATANWMQQKKAAVAKFVMGSVK